MVTSHINGHPVYYDGKDWRYVDTSIIIAEPDECGDRCSGDGYKRYIDNDGIKRYLDNDKPVDEMPLRPCAKCGEFPTLDGDDFCIRNLGRVMNACCGHGNKKGYIQFANGITIRGFFEIERDKRPCNVEYEVRSRSEIFERIKQLEAKPTRLENLARIEALKWVLSLK